MPLDAFIIINYIQGSIQATVRTCIVDFGRIPILSAKDTFKRNGFSHKHPPLLYIKDRTGYSCVSFTGLDQVIYLYVLVYHVGKGFKGSSKTYGGNSSLTGIITTVRAEGIMGYIRILTC